MTVTGSNLGVSEADVSVSIDGQDCSDVAIDQDHTTISCSVAAGTGANLALILDVGGQQISSLFSYNGKL